MNLKYRMGAGLVSSILAASLLAPAALAETTFEISGNGDNSTNKIEVTDSNNCTVWQKTETIVEADIKAKASTGGNTASGNTGGNVTIQTGNASATATLEVTGGSNTATDPCCCQKECNDTDKSAVISGNGENTYNKIKLTKTKSSSIKQKAETVVAAKIRARAKTGKNQANSNTGPGDVTITTGDATSSAGATVNGGSNTLNP